VSRSLEPDLEENLSIRYLARRLDAAGHVPLIVRFESAADLARARSRGGRGGPGRALHVLAGPRCWSPEASLPRSKGRPSGPADRRRGHLRLRAGRASSSRTTPRSDVVAIHEGEQTIVALAGLPAWTAEALASVGHRLPRSDGDRGRRRGKLWPTRHAGLARPVRARPGCVAGVRTALPDGEPRPASARATTARSPPASPGAR